MVHREEGLLYPGGSGSTTKTRGERRLKPPQTSESRPPIEVRRKGRLTRTACTNELPRVNQHQRMMVKRRGGKMALLQAQLNFGGQSGSGLDETQKTLSPGHKERRRANEKPCRRGLQEGERPCTQCSKKWGKAELKIYHEIGKRSRTRDVKGRGWDRKGQSDRLWRAETWPLFQEALAMEHRDDRADHLHTS